MEDEDYKESEISKKVKELMDDGYEFGEAVREALKEGFADGGSIGIEVLFKPKRQNLFMGGPALTGPALNIYNSMKAYQSFTDQEIADAIKEAGYSISTADSGTTPPPGNSTPGSSQPSGDGDGNRNIGSGGFGLQTPAQNVAEFQQSDIFSCRFPFIIICASSIRKISNLLHNRWSPINLSTFQFLDILQLFLHNKSWFTHTPKWKHFID